ncbi:secreted protein [Legionella steigerwaltii]|uniref:Secreted protein n=1 Tax=Legionella steigerwaltii TaxID=460 RepID=A0A378LEY0_9GAMM|nr:hypothetical protein [Legionella steigerwaltii]KTD78025.1 secreted protein [Legionella steigerwaltii]STY24422.1 secreted protein [Legionella steigerwaltii]
MIKYLRRNLVVALLLIVHQSAFSASSQFFNVSATGEPANLNITLCLNGKGPASCQDYKVSALTLTLFTTIPNHTYSFAGIKINTPGYVLSGCTASNNGYCLFTVSDKTAANIVAMKNNNAPWYPSIEAFEHYNSGRSHVFSQASFGGSMDGNNVVHTLNSSTSYPSGYNMSYLNSNYAFIYGGGYGDVPGSIGAYVARVNPITLQPIWYNQLINTYENGEWDYPGSLGILDDGYLYVSYGYRLAKINPETGQVITTLVLPTGRGLPKNTSFNGFNATADGTIIMKSVYRQAGCTVQGPDALLQCPDPTDVPPSILISVNPKTMRVIDNITLPAPVGARPTVTQYKNKNYVYLLEATTAIRYVVERGFFIQDSSWNPGTITLPGQTLCTSFVVINDWVVAQTNTLPSGTALSVISINQNNAVNQFSIQPFIGDPIPPEISAAFSTATADKGQAISWAPMSVSGDPATNLIYASDSLPGKIAAIKISESGLNIIWTADQRTTEFTTLINPTESRVLVGTDIPTGEIPGNNHNDFAVWRNALTGVEIARSPLLPAMTQGTMIQPYYFGDMFFEGQSGTLIKLSPLSTNSSIRDK